MSLVSLKRWHWIVISLPIGLLIAYARQQSADGLQERFGESINSQRRFEEMLVATEQSRPAFDSATVHSQSVADSHGGTKRAYIVAGLTFNGHYEEENGKLIPRWQPRFFVADVPYTPKVDLAKLSRPGRPDAAAQFRSIPRPTVVDLLDILSQAHGFTYTHAWWREMGFAEWLGASVVGIGFVWPTIINLIAFGSFRRPKEEKGIDLSKVDCGPKTLVQTSIKGSDQSGLHDFNSQLAEDLSANKEKTDHADAPEITPAVQLIAGAPDEHPPQSATASQAEFGAKEDDYYPTQVHASKHEPD